MTDLCFSKKFEEEKKSLYNSISKSIYFDTYYVLFVIIKVTEFDVLSNEIFFLASQKGSGIANIDDLNVKNDITY